MTSLDTKFTGARARFPILEAGRRLIQKPAFLFVLIILTAWCAASLLHANSFDNETHRRAVWNVFVEHRWPDEDPAEAVVRRWLNPNHTAFLIAPFVMFGPDFAAFWNVLFILMLLIGTRTSWAALATLLFALSPPMVFVVAAANIPGITTALGLLFILADKRGPVRGLAWALLAARPQENALTLLWTGIESIRQRDWQAFAFAGLLLIPAFLTLDSWLKIITRTAGTFQITPGGYYTLSIPNNSGIVAAAVFLGAFLAYRFIVLYRTATPDRRVAVTLRRRSDISRAEFAWSVIVFGLMLTPYYTMYMLWLVLLPVREFGVRRTLLLFAASMIIGMVFMRELTMPGVYYGGLALLVTVALIAPKPCAAVRAHRTILPSLQVASERQPEPV